MAATCPAGHASATDDYCDTCGAPIGAAGAGSGDGAAGPEGGPQEAGDGSPAASTVEGAGTEGGTGTEAGAGTGAGTEGGGASAAPAPVCPSCGATVVARYCESCGFDLETGTPAAPRVVTLALGTDRAHWDRMVGEGEPAFPAATPTLTFELTGDRAMLGRVRTGAPVDVDLALTGTAADPAVSHHQCLFERDDDVWLVTDAGSSNGTWINDAAEPLAAGESHVLAAGDRILMGAWTCLTVQVADASPAS